MKKLAIAASSVAFAAMPIVGVFADTTSLTDNISVTIDSSCTFSESTGQSFSDSSVAVGTQAELSNSGEHTFNVFCNDKGGWSVSAGAPVGLHDSTQTGTSHDFAYTAEAISAAAVEGKWSAAVTATPIAKVTYIPAAGGAIAGESASTAATGSEFKVTYDVWAGTQSPAGTYAGTVQYTLSHPGA